jgi:hypothetical protein
LNASPDIDYIVNSAKKYSSEARQQYNNKNYDKAINEYEYLLKEPKQIKNTIKHQKENLTTYKNL